MTADRFLICWPFVLAQECPFPRDWSNVRNFSNDAHDPGGKTMCGIEQREFDHYCIRNHLETRDVRLITKEQGIDIYENCYWLPYAPRLPVGLDLSFFDSAVNESTTEAVKILQHALSIPVDGLWGPITTMAVRQITHVAPVISAFTLRRADVYRITANFKRFGNDWERRTQEIGAESLKMAAA